MNLMDPGQAGGACTSVYCTLMGWLHLHETELSSLSLIVGIAVGLSVLALNIKKLLDKK